jgi:hypothetical protein
LMHIPSKSENRKKAILLDHFIGSGEQLRRNIPIVIRSRIHTKSFGSERPEIPDRGSVARNRREKFALVCAQPEVKARL